VPARDVYYFDLDMPISHFVFDYKHLPVAYIADTLHRCHLIRVTTGRLMKSISEDSTHVVSLTLQASAMCYSPMLDIGYCYTSQLMLLGFNQDIMCLQPFGIGTPFGFDMSMLPYATTSP
jgi:hypothetical protein